MVLSESLFSGEGEGTVHPSGAHTFTPGF